MCEEEEAKKKKKRMGLYLPEGLREAKASRNCQFGQQRLRIYTAAARGGKWKEIFLKPTTREEEQKSGEISYIVFCPRPI